MTNSKSQHLILKDYHHHLVTKEDLMQGDYLFGKVLGTDTYDIVWKYDIPHCTQCKKFGGDLIGKCIAVKLKEEEEKTMQEKIWFNKALEKELKEIAAQLVEKEEEKKMTIKPIKMGFIVDTDEAQYWVDADRFDLMGDHFRLFKGVNMKANFAKSEVNHIRESEQPHITINKHSWDIPNI